ncbi:MAG: DMT family transporter, partial [Synergistaceae bacterium]|nr:DMT family transporter [Synergistaceae bacterium]
TLPFMLKGGASELTLISAKGAVNMVFLGVVCSGVCYLLWYDALQVLPASEVGVFLYVNPVVSVVIAALFLDEPVTLSMLLGGVMVFSGVWFVNRVS